MKFLALALVLSTSSVSLADLVDPSVPAWRGEEGSQYYQWDSFTAPFAAPNFPTNLPAEFSSQVFNFVGGAQIVDGSIFSPGGLNAHVYGEGRPTSDVVLNLTYTAFDTTPESTQFFIGGFGPGASTLTSFLRNEPTNSSSAKACFGSPMPLRSMSVPTKVTACSGPGSSCWTDRARWKAFQSMFAM